MDFARELSTAMDLARRAGEAVLEHYQPGVKVDYKGGNRANPVTAADRVANDLIVRGLAEAFPDDAILAEESVADAGRHQARRLWCVDPLDGTREFIEHNGQFVVMIGLAIDGEARLGVVYAPADDHLYWGVPGRAKDVTDSLRGVRGGPGGIGAAQAGGRAADAPPAQEVQAVVTWTDGKQQLTVSRRSDTRDAVMVVSRSHTSKTVSAIARSLNIKAEHPLGSVGLKAAQVARGAAELYISMSTQTHEWDACAPEAIVRAAGGIMTDVLGDPLRYNKPDTRTPRGLLATNGALHSAAVAAIRPFAAERGWLT